MRKDLPDLSDEDVVRLLAAQKTLMENQPTLRSEYLEAIRHYAETYDVEVKVPDE